MRPLGARLLFGAAVAALLVGEASAQPPTTIPSASPDEDDQPRDEIVVTGTRIPRKDLTAASPVASFDREEMTEFGATAIEDFVNTLPQIKPDFGKTSNNPGDGTSSIDLRGLGRGRTLVLINGRRVAPTGTSSAIDANAIPSAMIERIEIVSGGASAVYGSDAVTGAINFITRKDFKGLELSSQADIYGAGDGAVYSGSLAAGTDFLDGRGHVAVFGDFLKRKPVLQGAREFSETVFLEDGAGGLFASGSFTEPNGRTLTGGPSLIFNPDGTVRPFSGATDFYNFAPSNYLQTPLERWSGGLFAEYEASAGVELYTELMYSRPTAARELAPPPATINNAPLVINSSFFAPSARPTLTARYDPDLDGIGFARISKRFEDTGPRITGTIREYWRGVLGFRADIAPDWSLDGFYSYNRNDSAETLDNAVSRARVLQGLLINPATGACVNPANGCVAVNIFGAGNISPAAQDFIRVDGLANEYSAVQHNAALVATGDLFEWSQGIAKASGGVEFRRNVASSQADPALATGDALGFNSFAGAEGSVNVYEAFAEVLVPLLADQPFARSLEIEMGGRFSQYSSNAGGVWTWKFGGQWMPVDGLRLSGMWQRAVRAPNVDELFQVAVNDLGFILGTDDFCAAVNDPVGRGLAPACVAQGMSPAALGVYNPPATPNLVFDQVVGGNADLRVERAGSITAGADYTFDLPVTLRVSADYFSITLEDAIGAFGPFFTCRLTVDPASGPCQAITRAPTGEPLSVTAEPLNLSLARARGLDLALDFSADVPRALGLGDARIAIRSQATHYFEIGQQIVDNAPFLDCAGGYSGDCAGDDFFGSNTFPKQQVSSSFSLTKGPFSGSLRWRWIAGMKNLEDEVNTLLGLPLRPLAVTSVPAKHYVDLSGSFEVIEGVTARAGVDNVFKTKPPLMGDSQVQANTDPSRYDVFGRRFFVGLDVRF